MFETLKKEVFEANLDLVKYNLVTFTWGNVSGIDREKGIVVIKPSGLKYENMKVSDMVVIDLDGKIIEGKLKPSSDTPTHLKLYNNFKDVQGIVHTHSTWATSWAQAGKSIPAYGTTHADYFYGEIPCTNKLTKEQIENGYEESTADVIIETFKSIKPLEVPGVIVNNHGPFSWGMDVKSAVHNAVVLEEVAKMAFNTTVINKEIKSIDSFLLNKHYSRKHGKDAYYGQ